MLGLEALAIISTVAVNRVTEYVNRLMRQSPLSDELRKAIAFLVAMLTGVGLSFVLDGQSLFVGSTFESMPPVALNVVVGIALGAGANGIHLLDTLIGLLQQKRAQNQGFTPTAPVG